MKFSGSRHERLGPFSIIPDFGMPQSMRATRRIGPGLVFILAALVLSSCALTLPIRDKATGRIVPDSIAEIATVNIGGIDNWLVIRGRNVHNPILLFLHGGPGSPELPLLRHFNGALEDSFVVVYWEQPGTCKSYSPDIPESALTVDNFVDYTKGVIDYLRARFERDKVYLVGHSWGSILAILTARKYPEVLAAVVGVGQVVSIVDSEVKSYHQTLDRAREKGDKAAIEELAAMGDPPSYVLLKDTGYDDFMTKRKWTLHFGLALYGQSSYKDYEKYYFEATEYTIFDLPKYIRGRKLTARALAHDLLGIDLMRQADELKVPVYFIMGKYDAISATTLFDDYVRGLKAQKKEVIWFDKSAHFPIFEEPAKFNAEMIRIMKETEAGAPAPLR
jgi:pimeloyl-ACP methyl ester carboxylesterase